MTSQGEKKIEWFERYVDAQSLAVNYLRSWSAEFKNIVNELVETTGLNGRIFICGNGGSAAMANHFAIDMNKVANQGGGAEIQHSCISLSANVSEITAIGNDLSFDRVFSEQLLWHRVGSDDLLIGVSTSGTSPNVVKACRTARENNAGVVALTSLRAADAGVKDTMLNYSNFKLVVPSRHYGIVEDCHSVFLHALAYSFAEGV